MKPGEYSPVSDGQRHSIGSSRAIRLSTLEKRRAPPATDPSGPTRTAPAATACGLAARAAMRPSTAAASRLASGFSRSTISAWHSRRPRLTPAANPTLRGSLTTSSANAAATSAEPSEEAVSTTTTRPRHAASRNGPKASPTVAAFSCVTTITSTRGWSDVRIDVLHAAPGEAGSDHHERHEQPEEGHRHAAQHHVDRDGQ